MMRLYAAALIFCHIVFYRGESAMTQEYSIPSTKGNARSESVNVVEETLKNVTSSMKKKSKPTSAAASHDKCFQTCKEMSLLVREQKFNMCRNLQNSLITYAKSTKSMLKNMMEEHQKSLDFLSNQVSELTNKVLLLNAEVLKKHADPFPHRPFQTHGFDCTDIKDTFGTNSKAPSGIYIIQPEGTHFPFEAFCDMDYRGGGWTVLQKRIDGTIDFQRTWLDYMDGFGELSGEFWLGLRKTFCILNQKNTSFMLNIALEAEDGSSVYAAYDNFWIEDEKTSFIMHVGRYFGTADADNEAAMGPLEKVNLATHLLLFRTLHWLKYFGFDLLLKMQQFSGADCIIKLFYMFCITLNQRQASSSLTGPYTKVAKKMY